jgi:flagellar biogenesis protein FliO
MMKFFAVLFLSFMLSKSYQIISNLGGEISGEKDSIYIKSIYEDDICNKYCLFYIFAFVLGAFWNVKKLRKMGAV